MVPYNFSTTQHLVNLVMDITAKGFGKSHSNFGVLLSVACMNDWSFASADIFSDLDVGACIFKKMCL